MNVQDLSANLRIASLTKLTQKLATCRTPGETLQVLQRGLEEANGFTASLLISTRELSQGRYRVVQTRLEGGSRKGLLDHSLENPGPVLSGGVIAAIIARAEPQLIQDVNWASDPFFHETLKGYASVTAIPFAGDHQLLSWVILLKRPPNKFTVANLEDSVLNVALIGSIMENQILAGQLARANEQIEKDALQVGELQRALLPANPPRVAGLEIAVSYEPSGHAGGDLYDFFPLDDSADDGSPSHWCIFIGDAAGHGLAAAVVMAILQSVLHSHPTDIAGPAKLLVHANRELCHKNIGGFFTAFLGVYEPESRRLTYANAGHPPPLLKCSSDEKSYPLDKVVSYPLGIEESESFKESTLQLNPGDTLLLYTDGITEAMDSKGNMFDRERLTHVLDGGSNQPAELIERLREAVRAHEQGQPAKDDQTIVAARAL